MNKGVNPINTMHQHKSAGSPMMLAASKEQPLSSSWLYAAIIAGLVLLGSGWLISKSNSGAIAADEETTEEPAGDALDVVAAVSESQASESDAKPAAAKPSAAASAAIVTTSSGESVTIKDQAAGSNVTIADMSIKKVSWVAVRDAKTKWILGARRFEPDTKTGIVVLLRGTTAGTAYEGVIYVDDGDKKFDFHKDFLVEGVATSFKAL